MGLEEKQRIGEFEVDVITGGKAGAEPGIR